MTSLLANLLLLAVVWRLHRVGRAARAESERLKHQVGALASVQEELESARSRLEAREAEVQRQRRAALNIAADAKEAAARASAAERQASQILSSSPTALLQIDPTGTIRMANAEAERMFGYSPGALVGKTIESLIPARLRRDHVGMRASFLEAPAKRQMGANRDLFAVRRDGTEFPVEIGLNPIETAYGRCVLSAVVDNTERDRTANLLRHRSEEMEQLLYTVSHDLKSPLVTILGFCGMIGSALDRGDVEDAKDSSQRVARAANTMGTLINDLLTLSRVGAQEEREWVDMEALFDEIREAVGGQLRAAQARLEVQTPLPSVAASAKSLLQIFQNLVVNAIVHGCRAPDATIEVGCLDRGPRLEFFVRDHGPGIPKEHHRKVFVVFRRLPSTQEGTGLGLAIVLKAARSVGGDAWVESTPGQGATFWVSLPKLAAASSTPPEPKGLPTCQAS